MSEIGKVVSHHDAADNSQWIGVKFSPEVHANAYLLNAVFSRIADQIAERWVADHYQEVVALIRPEAIATLTVAEAAKEINKTLKEELPERTREVVRTEVYQRGLLGGLTRIR